MTGEDLHKNTRHIRRVSLLGGSEVPDLKLDPEELFADLELLYNRMVALGVTVRDGEVYLEDLDGKL